jgi:hypothetical protein
MMVAVSLPGISAIKLLLVLFFSLMGPIAVCVISETRFQKDRQNINSFIEHDNILNNGGGGGGGGGGGDDDDDDDGDDDVIIINVRGALMGTAIIRINKKTRNTQQN